MGFCWNWLADSLVPWNLALGARTAGAALVRGCVSQGL